MGLLPTGIARAWRRSATCRSCGARSAGCARRCRRCQVAIMQANELERQRTAKLTKALEEQAAAVAADPPPSAPAAPDEGGAAPGAPAPTPQAAPASGGSDKGKGASRRRHHKRSGRSHSKGREPGRLAGRPLTRAAARAAVGLVDARRHRHDARTASPGAVRAGVRRAGERPRCRAARPSRRSGGGGIGTATPRRT